MKSLLIVTHIDFWKKGAGHRARLASILNYLNTKINITIVYVGTVTAHDAATIFDKYPAIKFELLENRTILTYKDYKIKFGEFMKDKSFDFALIEYIEMAFVLPYLSSDTVTLLDTHDIVSDRIESFKKNNLSYQGIELTKDEEFEIFDYFDFIILIQKNDLEKVREEIGMDRILLVPHAVNFTKKEIPNTVSNITYVGSEYAPNVEGLTWFLKTVWPSIHRQHQLTLTVYGNICNKLSKELIAESRGVIIHGFMEDLEMVYETAELLINPVRCGAGLKIKNVEALGNGIPLVTTSHGASGTEDGSGKSFLVADTAQEFESSISLMVTDYAARKRIADNAFAYAQLNFSEGICYQSLSKILGLQTR